MTDSASVIRIGLDIGGTKTCAAYRLSGNEPGAAVESFVTQGANLQTEGPARMAERISTIVADIRRRKNSNHPALVVAGIAGAGRPEDQRRLEDIFHASTADPLNRLMVCSDAVAALEGAFSGGSGTIVIAGTGSGAYARDQNGDFKRSGGWGSLLGDPGSGMSIGRKALRCVAEAMDGGDPTVLTERCADVLSIHDGHDLVRSVYQENLNPSSVARLAIDAAAGGDPVATTMVSSEVDVLARESTRIFDGSVEPRFALIGGLCENPWYRELLVSRILAYRPLWRRVEPDGGPEIGALRMTEKLV